jgi:hypothetical protein
MPASEAVASYYIYRYCHIDDFDFVREPQELVASAEEGYSLESWAPAREDLPDFLNRLRDRFRSAGWEGDGEICAVWLPPFVSSDLDSSGEVVWMVKQSNKGISFLACRSPLKFAPILEQNQ